VAQSKGVDRGFIDPNDSSRYVMHGHRELKIPKRWEELTPGMFLAIMDDIANRYPFLNTKDLKSTLEGIREEMAQMRKLMQQLVDLETELGD